MIKNKIEITKSKNLDGLEIKNASFHNVFFPQHFHLDWSLVYLRLGSESIGFNDLNFSISQNSFVLIPPYSIHSNGNENSWSYTAIYINIDVVKYICEKLKIDYYFIQSQPYILSYSTSFDALTNTNVLDVLSELLLQNHAKENVTDNKKYIPEIANYLIANSDVKITLDILESKFKINKFKIWRLFNAEIGISPIEYQNSIRIEKSKSLFYTNNSISNIALEVGFFDQSHFTHNFKKYVGVTPKQYKDNCKILQDLNVETG